MSEHDFGLRLRQLRHGRKETLEQVSEATGLSVAMLSRVERGERLPSPESVEALAKHFGLPIDDLMSQTIANRMLNRYGYESSSRAAERLQGGRRVEQSMAVAWDAEPAMPSAFIESAPRSPELGSLRVPSSFARRPIEELFPESAAMDSLSDSARVAEVAIESAMAAAERAMASSDPKLQAEGRRVMERLWAAVKREGR